MLTYVMDFVLSFFIIAMLILFCVVLFLPYLKAEKVPKTPAELMPTANPIMKPIFTRSKQEGPATGGGL